MLPKVTREDLEHALRRFDVEERSGSAWQGWESRANFKHAIEFEGHRYPVKRVVALATGVDERQFSGGNEANRFVQALGFQVVPLRSDSVSNQQPPYNQRSLADLLQRVCDLQGSYSPHNTPEMKERGDLIRNAIPEPLRQWLPDRINIQVTGRDATGSKSRVPWVRIFNSVRSPSPTDGIYLVFLFAADGTSIALSLNQGTTVARTDGFRPKSLQGIEETVRWGRSVLQQQIRADGLFERIDLRDPQGKGKGYEQGNIAALTYESGAIPDDQQIRNDLLKMVDLLTLLYEAETSTDEPSISPSAAPAKVAEPTPDPRELTGHIRRSLTERGFVYEPWQVATFVAAVRTKPFIILAGISGTGKTKLPVLAARSSGAKVRVMPVRPDWHDSGDLLGYTDLSGEFRSKPFLALCAEACMDRSTEYFAVIDEMNIARVEHYFAEVLSRIEDHSLGDGCSAPLVEAGGKGFAPFEAVGLPTNLAIVGTVNMDESTHGFSRKVLDRAFTLELSEVDLTQILPIGVNASPAPFGAAAWRGKYRRLSEVVETDPVARGRVEAIVEQLQILNRSLSLAQLQIGFRSRDEIALFVLNAETDQEHFVDHVGDSVDPLDLALMMKLLPRIAGSSRAVQKVLQGIVESAVNGKTADQILQDWQGEGSPNAVRGAQWPRTTARACLMLQRLDEGYTSYFL